MENFEKLGKILPIGSVIVILCSSIKLVLYYKVFNIAISDFLNLGEYATLFVDDTLEYLLIFGIGVVVNTLNSNVNRSDDGKKSTVDYSIYKDLRRWVIFASIIITIFMAVAVYFLPNLIDRLGVIKLGLYFLLICLYFYAQVSKLRFGYYSMILVALLMYCGFDGYIDSQKVLSNSVDLKYTLTTKSEFIQTNDNLKYLGKSENYIFLYDIKMIESKIIKVQDINEMRIIEKRR